MQDGICGGAVRRGEDEANGRALQTVLEAMVSGPERRVGELPLLTEAEREQAMVEWNGHRQTTEPIMGWASCWSGRRIRRQTPCRRIRGAAANV